MSGTEETAGAVKGAGNLMNMRFIYGMLSRFESP